MTKSDAKHSAAHHIHAAELLTTAALLCLRHAEERVVAEAVIEAANAHLNQAVGYLDQMPDAEPPQDTQGKPEGEPQDSLGRAEAVDAGDLLGAHRPVRVAVPADTER